MVYRDKNNSLHLIKGIHIYGRGRKLLNLIINLKKK